MNRALIAASILAAAALAAAFSPALPPPTDPWEAENCYELPYNQRAACNDGNLQRRQDYCDVNEVKQQECFAIADVTPACQGGRMDRCRSYCISTYRVYSACD